MMYIPWHQRACA